MNEQRPIRNIVDDAKRLAELKARVIGFREALNLLTWPDALTQELIEENRKETNARSTTTLPELRGMAEGIDEMAQGLLNKIESRESAIFLECHKIDYEATRELDPGELRERVGQDLAKITQMLRTDDPQSITLYDILNDAKADAQGILDDESNGRR